MIAVRRGDVVDQYLFGADVDRIPAHHEHADAVDATSRRSGCRPRVEHVDTPGGGEGRVVREPEQSPFAAAAHRQLRRRRREEPSCRRVDQANATRVLLEHDDSPAGERFDRGRGVDGGDEAVGETTRRRGPHIGCSGDEHRRRQQQDAEPTHLGTVPVALPSVLDGPGHPPADRRRRRAEGRRRRSAKSPLGKRLAFPVAVDRGGRRVGSVRRSHRGGVGLRAAARRRALSPMGRSAARRRRCLRRRSTPGRCVWYGHRCP